MSLLSVEAFKQKLLVGHEHQPGNLSSVLDKALAGGSSKQKDKMVSDGASGTGVGDGHRPAHSHFLMAGVATVSPTDLILLSPTGPPGPQTDSIDDDEEDYDDIGAA